MNPNMKRVSEIDLVPPDWADGDAACTVEQWGQREYDSGLAQGTKDGLARAAFFVMRLATERFADGDMQQADRLRAVSLDIKALIEKETT